MHVTFVDGVRGKKGFVEIEDATLIFKNFSGEASKYNHIGSRNFCIKIPSLDIADCFIKDVNENGIGWNVKVRDPRDENEDPFIFMKVNVKFNEYGPDVYLITNGNMVRLDEESISCLDYVDMAYVDLAIRPSDGEINGKHFRSAYLKALYVTQNLSGLAAKYADSDHPME